MIPIYPLLGGVLIGLAASGLLLTHGKIAGISGITKGLFAKIPLSDRLWRYSFLMGVIGGGGIVIYISPFETAHTLNIPLWQAILAGTLVGIGTSIGNGCTSGHGVCGLGRRSKRSLSAVLVFLFMGILTMYITTHLLQLPRL